MKNKTKKMVTMLVVMATLIASGFSNVSVNASSDNWYTYYNDDNTKQVAYLCKVVYKKGNYTMKIDTIQGNGYNKITPTNGTTFSGSSYKTVSKTSMSATAYVNSASNDMVTAQFSVTLNNYSSGTLIYGTISD